MKEKTCCFFGHRKIEDTAELRKKLYDVVERLIAEQKIDTFLFGSKSKFNSLCYDAVTKCKEKYPHIRRVFVRAEYPWISEDYKNNLLEYYEDTYYPERILGAGRAVYVERNEEMIEKSSVCIVYYNPDQAPACRRSPRLGLNAYQPKSGTKIAYMTAKKKGKTMINLNSSEQSASF